MREPLAGPASARAPARPALARLAAWQRLRPLAGVEGHARPTPERTRYPCGAPPAKKGLREKVEASTAHCAQTQRRIGLREREKERERDAETFLPWFVCLFVCHIVGHRHSDRDDDDDDADDDDDGDIFYTYFCTSVFCFVSPDTVQIKYSLQKRPGQKNSSMK